ncbi:MAG: hypothetical protein PHS14_12730 [Elusimicrobia bacterium]|nr:hypothetical protein [Elusimicrobiota bacterium]
MTDEPKKDHPEDIESILSDLDAILTDMGGVAPAEPAPEEPPKAPPKIEAPRAVAPPPPPPPPAPKPVDIPKPAEPPKPVEAVKPAEPPKPASIELAPRDGMIKPPEKKPEPPKPAPKLPEQKGIELSAGPSIPMPAAAPPPPPPSPAPAPKPAATPAAAPVPAAPPAPTAAPAPAPVVASTKIEELPADTPREQIRRVAYIHTASCFEVRTAFAAFLSQAARTISKKPLFLREVLSHEVGAASDPNAVVQKSLQAKAVAILAVVEGWPPAKVDEMSEACSRANLLFRAVAPADAQKKSTAVDVIVDMMLLPGES